MTDLNPFMVYHVDKKDLVTLIATADGEQRIKDLVKGLFRKVSMDIHPDKVKDLEETFKDYNTAYSNIQDADGAQINSWIEEYDPAAANPALISRALTTIKAQNAAIEDLEHKLEKAQAQLARAREAVMHGGGDIGSTDPMLEKELADLKVRYGELDSLYRRLQTGNSALEKKYRKVEAEHRRISGDLSRLKHKETELIKGLEEQRDFADFYKKTHDKSKPKIEEANLKVAQMQKQLLELRKASGRSYTELVAAKNAKNALEAQLDIIRPQLESTNFRIERMNSELNETKRKLAESQIVSEAAQRAYELQVEKIKLQIEKFPDIYPFYSQAIKLSKELTREMSLANQYEHLLKIQDILENVCKNLPIFKPASDLLIITQEKLSSIDQEKAIQERISEYLNSARYKLHRHRKTKDDITKGIGFLISSNATYSKILGLDPMHLEASFMKEVTENALLGESIYERILTELATIATLSSKTRLLNELRIASYLGSSRAEELSKDLDKSLDALLHYHGRRIDDKNLEEALVKLGAKYGVDITQDRCIFNDVKKAKERIYASEKSADSQVGFLISALKTLQRVVLNAPIDYALDNISAIENELNKKIQIPEGMRSEQLNNAIYKLHRAETLATESDFEASIRFYESARSLLKTINNDEKNYADLLGLRIEKVLEGFNKYRVAMERLAESTDFREREEIFFEIDHAAKLGYRKAQNLIDIYRSFLAPISGKSISAERLTEAGAALKVLEKEYGINVKSEKILLEDIAKANYRIHRGNNTSGEVSNKFYISAYNSYLRVIKQTSLVESAIINANHAKHQLKVSL